MKTERNGAGNTDEIAKKTKSTPKRVDNIMLLIRKKLKRYL